MFWAHFVALIKLYLIMVRLATEPKSERASKWSQENGRERRYNKKKTEDTIIFFLISRKKLRSPPTTTSYYRWLDSTTLAPRTSYFYSHSNAHVHVASLFFIAFIKVGHTVFIPLVYATTNRLTYVRSWGFNNTWFFTSSDISTPWWLSA